MGFTLAEVLTTLMVIGVVAAMTIPTLMNSTNDQQSKVAFKKAVSVLSQGVQLMAAKEIECKVTHSGELAECFQQNVLSGSLTGADNGKTPALGKNVVVTSDGLAYQFYYNAEKSNNAGDQKRSIEDICGSNMGSASADFDGTNAACAVIVDVNGFSKGTKEFKIQNFDGQSEPLRARATGQGDDQQALLISGTGIRPVYTSNRVNAPAVNKGYEWMFGTTTAPFTTGSGS